MLPQTSKYLGVTTIGGHTSRALDFQARTDIWAVIGQSSPWVSNTDLTISDTNPPLPDPNTITLPNLVVAKKAVLQLVVPDSVNGTVQAYGQMWRLLTPADALTANCRWVLVTASFDYNEAPISVACSYLTTALAIGNTTANVASAAMYQIGDTILLGPQGQQTSITAINTTTNVLTFLDASTAALLPGQYISDLSAAPFTYRQDALISHDVLNVLISSGQALVPIAMMTSYLVEYYANYTPIPRSLAYRDQINIVLTF